MTHPMVDQPRRRPFFWWLLVLAALILGYAIGRITTKMVSGPLGTCTRSDSTVVARNVSQQTCQSNCASCSWSPN